MSRDVSGNNVDPDYNLDYTTHDLCSEVALVTQLCDLICDNSDAFVLILNLGAACLLVNLAFTVTKVGNIPEW